VARFTGILIHRNASVALLDVLDAWLAQTELERLIVVENGSTAEHLEALRAGLERAGLERAGLESAGLERPGLESAGLERGRPPGDNGPLIELLEAGENLGFGPGANFGLRHWLASCNTDEDTEWVALAPHDAAPAVDCLERMGAALDARPGAALACADVGDGSIPVFDPYFGGMVTVPGPAATPADPDGWEDVDYPHGTLMVARRAALEEIGLFDERYFAYCEEADLGARARQLGWGVGLVRGARVTNTHLGSSVALVDYLQHRNTLLLVRTHSGLYHAFIRLCISLYQLAGGVLRPARRPLVFDARARWEGIVDFVRGRYGPPPERYLTPR